MRENKQLLPPFPPSGGLGGGEKFRNLGGGPGGGRTSPISILQKKLTKIVLLSFPYTRQVLYYNLLPSDKLYNMKCLAYASLYLHPRTSTFPNRKHEQKTVLSYSLILTYLKRRPTALS
jgi:hypothetical protein